MAALRVRLYGRADEELAGLTGQGVPEWAVRLYGLHGDDPKKVSAGAAVSALAGELEHRLKKLSQLFAVMERNGWTLELDGDAVLCRLEDLDDLSALEQLERLGVWVLAKEHAPHDATGSVRWEDGAVLG
jgi:hypothetical protein